MIIMIGLQLASQGPTRKKKHKL